MCAKSTVSDAPARESPAKAKKESTIGGDARLVQGCLRGNEAAWSALVDKYKNLIFSIPIKYGFSADDSAEIFQSVCVELLTELPKLRNPKALPKWIMQVAAHKCFHHKRRAQRTENRDMAGELVEQPAPERADAILKEAEEEQILREALLSLPPRCRELIHMLFFEEPARPYDAIASQLGLATGSIGFIRQRCLERLRKRLTEAGFA